MMTERERERDREREGERGGERGGRERGRERGERGGSPRENQRKRKKQVKVRDRTLFKYLYFTGYLEPIIVYTCNNLMRHIGIKVEHFLDPRSLTKHTDKFDIDCC